MSDYISDRDLAERIGKSREFVQARCRAKDWPHLRFGRSLAFTAKHVAAIEALCEVTPAANPVEKSWDLAPGRRTA